MKIVMVWALLSIYNFELLDGTYLSRPIAGIEVFKTATECQATMAKYKRYSADPRRNHIADRPKHTNYFCLPVRVVEGSR